MCVFAGLADSLDTAAFDKAILDQLLCWLHTILVPAAASDNALKPLVHKVTIVGDTESNSQQSLLALTLFSRLVFAQSAPHSELESDFAAAWLPDSPYAKMMDQYPAKHSLIWPLSEVVWRLYRFSVRAGAKLTDTAWSGIWDAQAQPGKEAAVYTATKSTS